MKTSSTTPHSRTVKAAIGSGTQPKKLSPAAKKPPARKAITEFQNFCKAHGFQTTLVALEKDLKRSGISIDSNSQPLRRTSPTAIQIDPTSPLSSSDSEASSSQSESVPSTSRPIITDRSSKIIERTVNLPPSKLKPTTRPNSSRKSSTNESSESDPQTGSASSPSSDSEPHPKKVSSVPACSTSSSDTSSSSGSDSDPEPQPKSKPLAKISKAPEKAEARQQSIKKVAKSATIIHPGPKPQVHSISDSCSSDSVPDKPPATIPKAHPQKSIKKAQQVPISPLKVVHIDSEPSSGSDSSSESDAGLDSEPVEVTSPSKPKPVEASSDDNSSVVELDFTKKNVKSDPSGELTSSPIKRKPSFTGAPAEPKRHRASEPFSLKNASTKSIQVPSDVVNLDHKDKTKQKKTNEPFRRVRAEEVQLDRRLSDNSFLAKGGAQGSYGYKAHQALSVTRGKAFTKEKNKKKRGSYRGGIIDTSSHSIKFD